MRISMVNPVWQWAKWCILLFLLHKLSNMSQISAIEKSLLSLSTFLVSFPLFHICLDSFNFVACLPPKTQILSVRLEVGACRGEGSGEVMKNQFEDEQRSLKILFDHGGGYGVLLFVRIRNMALRYLQLQLQPEVIISFQNHSILAQVLAELPRDSYQMQIQLKTSSFRPIALLSASLTAHRDAKNCTFSLPFCMRKYCWSSWGWRNFFMKRQAQFFVIMCSILEFFTRSMPIPNTLILQILNNQLAAIWLSCHNQNKVNNQNKAMEGGNQIKVTIGESSEQPSRRNIKALLCQIKPTYKNKIATIQRITVSLEKYSKKDNFDIVLFPEMAFSGYNFASHADALPYSVKQNEGVDFQFPRSVALRLKTYVVFGYIEAVEYKANEFTLYNSAAVIDRQGQMIANYRKKHLYYNDKLWAAQGNNFVSFELKTVQNKRLACVLGICMDINPKDFTSGQFQLADYAVKSKADVLLFLTNWVDSEKDSIHSNDVAATFKYWLHRLSPVIVSGRCTLMLAADRVGKEFDHFAKKEIMFYGSSAAIMLNPHKIISNLDVQSQGYLLVQTFLP